MQSRVLLKGVIIFLAILASGFYFAGNASAALPVEAGLGETCSQPGGRIPAGCFDVDGSGDINVQDCGAPENASCSLCVENIQCSNGLFCGELGECVECESDNQCSIIGGETCEQGVCTSPDGNDVGGPCLDNSNCAASLECVRNACQQSTGGGGNNTNNPPGGENDWTGIDLTIQDVFAIVNGLACWFARIASLLMVIFIIIAGLRFMTARGNPKAFDEAKKNFGHVLIGLLVIMGVYVIIATVANAVGVDFSFIPLVC